MPLETTVNHIADLEPLYPFGTDNRLQGDNHIRNIKNALKNDIPLTTPATATGITLLTIASPAAARTALGSTATGDALFTAATAAAARAALELKQIQPIDYAFSAGALILKLNPTTLDFRSTTLDSGAVTTVSNAAQITTTISSGSTGGTVNAVQSDIVILAINNAGTMELAWTNLAGGTNLDEMGVITTVAEGGAGAADSATVIYSTTARTSVAYRVVGLFRSTQTTAGTWAQTPSLVQGIGGQALAAMASLGYGQKWQDFTGSRAKATTYYNTTGKPISVYVTAVSTALAETLSVTMNGFIVAYSSTSDTTGRVIALSFIVPAQSSYIVNNGIGNPTLFAWSELR